MSDQNLSERYVDAALRSVPVQKRSDMGGELRASIADAVDARVGAGEDRQAAEVAVLTELGDPARLAAGLTDRPLYLIGPAFYLDYVRLLRALAVTVLPLTAVAVAVVQIVRRGSIGDVIGDVIATTLTTSVQLAFWTTALFAFFERVPGIKTPLTGPWNPSMLPTPRAPQQPRQSQLVALAVWNLLLVTAVLLAPRLSPEHDATGQAIGILHPLLYSSGLISVYIGLLVAVAALALASRYQPRLVPGVHGLGIVTAATVIWAAAHDRVVNPAFAQAVGWTPDVVRWIHIGLIITFALAIATDLVEALRRLARR